MCGRWLILATMPVLLAGCMKSDTEGLARIGRKLAGRSQAMAGDVRKRLEGNWKKLAAPESPTEPDPKKPAPLVGEPPPPPPAEPDAVERVRQRLRWDKCLQGLDLSVALDGEDLVLKGKVENAEQRERAVSLAETTVGVPRVLVMLDMPMPKAAENQDESESDFP